MCTTIDWNDMSDLGLIQHLNEQILHPIGLAISRDPITGISEKVIVAEDGFFVYDSRTVAPINFDDQRIKQHLKKLLETKVASKKKEVLVELCRHKGIRVGKVIHLPTAIMDTEQPSDEFNEFFNDASIPFLCKESSMDEDAMLANTVLFRSLESLVVFYRSLPYSLLIRIDIQTPILTIVGSTWDSSTYCSSWGQYRSKWFLSDTIDQAIERAFPFADERKKLAFENRNAPTYESEDGLPF